MKRSNILYSSTFAFIEQSTKIILKYQMPQVYCNMACENRELVFWLSTTSVDNMYFGYSIMYFNVVLKSLTLKLSDSFGIDM